MVQFAFHEFAILHAISARNGSSFGMAITINERVNTEGPVGTGFTWLTTTTGMQPTNRYKLIALDSDEKTLREIAETTGPLFETLRVRDPQVALNLCEDEPLVRVIVTEHVVHQQTGQSLLEVACRCSPHIRRVMLTTYADQRSSSRGCTPGQSNSWPTSRSNAVNCLRPSGNRLAWACTTIPAHPDRDDGVEPHNSLESMLSRGDVGTYRVLTAGETSYNPRS